LGAVAVKWPDSALKLVGLWVNDDPGPMLDVDTLSSGP